MKLAELKEWSGWLIKASGVLWIAAVVLLEIYVYLATWWNLGLGPALYLVDAIDNNVIARLMLFGPGLILYGLGSWIEGA